MAKCDVKTRIVSGPGGYYTQSSCPFEINGVCIKSNLPLEKARRAMTGHQHPSKREAGKAADEESAGIAAVCEQRQLKIQ
ncbi:MAG TPA: hypothetical protein VN711_03325 [Candidatus Saccharimonadales bacterium]|nr:hypothetical protein [Candidatus Saccharimonadales bacterium]